MMPDISSAVGQTRTLVVPFGLGRPFGVPHDVEGQTNTLHALLGLCARDEVPLEERLQAPGGV